MIHHLRCSPVLVMKIHRQETCQHQLVATDFTWFWYEVSVSCFAWNSRKRKVLRGAVEVLLLISFAASKSANDHRIPWFHSSPLCSTHSRSKPLPQRAQFDPRSGKESRSIEVMDPGIRSQLERSWKCIMYHYLFHNVIVSSTQFTKIDMQIAFA